MWCDSAPGGAKEQKWRKPIDEQMFDDAKVSTGNGRKVQKAL